MKMKKIIMTLGTFGALSTTAFSISCSTTWTSWHPKNVPSQKIDYSKYRPWNAARNFKEAYIVRRVIKDNDKIAGTKKAYFVDAKDPTKVTVNLDYLNNVNELIYVMKKVLKISLPIVDVDQYWDYITGSDSSKRDLLLNYVKDIPSVLHIKFVEGNNDNIIDWDFTKIKDDIVKGYSDFFDNKTEKIQISDQDINQYLSDLQNQSYKDKWFVPGPGGAKVVNPVKPTGISDASWYIHKSKLFDVQVNGLSNDQPVDFADVAHYGAGMISIPSVSALLSADGNFALQLSKLVNLPTSLFAGFSNLLRQFGTTCNSIYQTPEIQSWNQIKTLKDNDNKLIKKDGKVVEILNKNYNLKPQDTPKGLPNSGLNGKDNQTILLAKFMETILKKDS